MFEKDSAFARQFKKAQDEVRAQFVKRTNTNQLISLIQEAQDEARDQPGLQRLLFEIEDGLRRL